MSQTAHFTLLAQYNAWMNHKLYEAASTLPAAELEADRKAFFGSLQATLNHILVGDTIWLQRFASNPRFAPALAAVSALPAPNGLDQPQCADFAALRERRAWLDGEIQAWLAGLGEADFDEAIAYRRLNGETNRRQLGALLLHFFNHQTHHRGQATTLLSQAGVDVGPTDLLLLTPELDS